MEQGPGTSRKEKARHALGGFATALFIDVPFLIDSLWRQLDFGLNRERDYIPPASGVEARLASRPAWRRLDFWLFALVAMFVGYGPIWDGFCTILAPPASAVALQMIGWVEIVGALVIFAILWWRLRWGYEVRFMHDSQDGGSMAVRRLVVQLMLVVASAVGPVLLASCGLFLLSMAADQPCKAAQVSAKSLLHLAVCLAAIAAFWFALRKWERNIELLIAQFVLVAIVAAATWCLGEDAEASNGPYRHVFVLAAAAATLVLLLAHPFARWLFRNRGEIEGAQALLVERLPRTELFEGRDDPALTLTRLVHAVVRGIVHRPLMTLLPPALLGFMSPARWLDVAVLVGLLLSVLFLTWGSIADRWQQMVLAVERWFLRGTSLAVTLFVIVIAVLRVLRIDYVTTIVDSAPFGALFGIVAMGYALSWLVEYWINRIVGTEVLCILGAQRDGVSMPYIATGIDPGNLRVDAGGRFMLWHAIGRFLVVGAKGDRPGDIVRFHSHDLSGLLTRLAGPEEPRSAALVRQVESYFFGVNSLLFAVIAAFGWYYVVESRGVDVAYVVKAADVRVDETPPGLKDLAKLLEATGENASRPAIVVAASGGGTRAALYTAHVLEGLHRLKRDRDIVLLSGVSGGGVALTFFAADYRTLSGDDPAAWDRFRRNVSDKFIEDVLEGATEWRVLGREPLSKLLVESIERRLTTAKFADIAAAPALLLNTTIVAHPADDSQVLRRTLDPASPTDCAELALPFTSLTGGRLIFTDLTHVQAFPETASRLPDVRLPYRIVRDPQVSLAAAATLQANFPPVFPNARVLITGYTQAPECPDRSYFVTDGGAQENLGLVSALYAVRSALTKMKEGTPVRPIHFVLAEASATGYDFTQDRGLGAALGGAKERLTGGLTDELIDQTEALYRKVTRSERALEFHYLALPLVFRSRGGFGTHWMQAEKITVHDPRDRRKHTYFRTGDLGGVTLDKNALRSLWTDLHDPKASFCDDPALARPPAGKEHGTFTVRRWICTNRDHTLAPRDVHVEEWSGLVRKLGAQKGEKP